jgi:YVTN family beta-propeller protein
MNRRLLLFFWASTCFPAALGCQDPETHYQYDPYLGDAFPGQRTPVTIPAGGLGIVTNSYADSLSLLDLGTGAEITRVPVGRDPVGLDGPHHVAVNPAAAEVYIALSYPVVATGGPHASHGSSLQYGYVQKLALDDFRILGQVRVDANPGDIVASQDGSRLVVSHFDLQRAIQNPGNLDAARATLALVDASALALSGSPDPVRIPVCIAPHGVALSRPDGAVAYVACYGEDSIAVVDLNKQEVSAIVPVGPGAGIGDPSFGPYSAVLSPDGKTLAIGNTESKDVRFFDIDTQSVDLLRTLDTLGAPFFTAWTPDGTGLYVPTQNPDSLILVDVTNNNQELARRDFLPGECPLPHVVDRVDDSRVILVCEGDHMTAGRVLLLDAATLATIGTGTDVGTYPDAIMQVRNEP